MLDAKHLYRICEYCEYVVVVEVKLAVVFVSGSRQSKSEKCWCLGSVPENGDCLLCDIAMNENVSRFGHGDGFRNPRVCAAYPQNLIEHTSLIKFERQNNVL